MPSDHLIPNSKYFVEIIENISLKLKKNEWMTLGNKTNTSVRFLWVY